MEKVEKEEIKSNIKKVTNRETSEPPHRTNIQSAILIDQAK